jgi:S-layer protein
MISIETLNVFDQDAAFTLSAVDQASVTTLNFVRGDGGTFTTGANVSTVGLTNISVGGVAGTADDLIVELAATNTSLTLNLDRVTQIGAATDENIEINGAALATVTVNASGTASTIDVLDVAGATTINLNAGVAFTATSIATTGTATLNLSGAGAVSIGELDSDINTVTSTATGALTVEIGANVDTVLTSGSGDDVITASTTDTIATTDALAVNAGGGTDILVIAAAADVSSTADGARYTNFETVRVSDSYDGDFVAGITALQLTGATSKSYTDLTATQAANIQVRGDETSATFALKTATGTSDALTLTMGTGLTTSAATDIVTGMTVTGFETLNIVENGGATAAVGAAQTAIIAAFTGATLNDINLSGRAVTLSNIATTVSVDIDGTNLTGNGAATGAQGLTVAGSAVAGSVINGSAVRDSFTVGAEGSTYNGNAGNDAFSATVALIAADGATDLVLNGGTGTDTLTLTNTTGNTITDTHFTNVRGMEALTLTNTGAGDTVITTGAAFNAAFVDGVTITSGLIAAGQDITINGGLASVNMTVSIAATSQTGAATETNLIVTGSGNDTVTYTDTGWIGVAGGAGGTITIDTNAGNDTISVTVGTLVSDTTDVISITGGAGQDSITKVGTNANDAQGVVTFEFAAGDSATGAHDTITGYDVNGTNLFADALNFEGTSTVASFTSTTDVGVIKSHTVSAGIVQFDDVADYSTALVIDSTNLADVVGYLQANLSANQTAAFAFDSDANGSADATMVFHQGSGVSVMDDLVLLAGVTGVDALITTNIAGANDIYIM